MEVYIEYVILDNFVIDYIILYLTLFSIRQKICYLKVILSSMIGTTFAVFLPFITLSNIYLFLLKMAIGLLMIVVVSKNGFKKFIISYFLFITYTFLLGGLCFGILYFLFGNVSLNGILLYQFEIPISILLLLIFLYFLFIKKLVSNKRKFGSFTYPVEIFKEDKSLILVGFLDTGNQVYDKKGNPIIIISLKTFMKAYPNISYLKIITSAINEFDIKGCEYIVLNTANQTSKMLVFNADLLKIKDNDKFKVFKNVTIGVSQSNFGQKFDCILHNELLF